MVTHEVLEATGYGLDQYSRDAFDLRHTEALAPQLNVATFHLVRRPGLDGVVPQGAPQSFTLASTGIGFYDSVYGAAVESEVRINESHSEHRFIKTVLDDLHTRKIWPGQYVIDWVYTERPACPDVWFKHRRLHDGCATEIRMLEETQRLRHWDFIGKDRGDALFGLRDDLEITVFSTFDSATEIRNGALMGLIRRSAKTDLYHALVDLYQESHAEDGAGTEEYDLMECDETIPSDAWDEAEKALSSWEDCEPSVTAAEFEDHLAQEALECVQAARQRLGGTM